jgi:hypothetical protein
LFLNSGLQNRAASMFFAIYYFSALVCELAPV